MDWPFVGTEALAVGAVTRHHLATRFEGIVLHNDTFADADVVIRHGIPVTTPVRTAFDLGRRYGRTLAVIRVDARCRRPAWSRPASRR